MSTIVFNAVGFNGNGNDGLTDLNPTYYTPAACDSANYDLCLFDHPYGNAESSAGTSAFRATKAKPV
jgi:hypothetical protein